MHRKKGQSILEYVIVLSAIVAAIVVAASSVIQPGVNKALSSVMDSVGTSANKIACLQ